MLFGRRRYRIRRLLFLSDYYNRMTARKEGGRRTMSFASYNGGQWVGGRQYGVSALQS